MSYFSVETSNSQYLKFQEIGQIIQNLAKQLGIKLQILNKQRPSCFLKLNEADQLAAIERLKIYQQLFEISASEISGQASEKKLLWIALKLLKLVPSADLMSLIEDDDLIEVFVGSRQVYRSFNYYDCCSYSFDELESTPWDLLFHRDDSTILQKMWDEAGEVIRSRKTLKSNTPEHTVSEISSPFKNKILYKLKYIVPIGDAESNRPDCLVTVLTARTLETAPIEERIERMSAYQARRNITPLF